MKTGWWQLKYLLFSSRKLGKIFTQVDLRIFFRWVGLVQPPTRRYLTLRYHLRGPRQQLGGDQIQWWPELLECSEPLSASSSGHQPEQYLDRLGKYPRIDIPSYKLTYPTWGKGKIIFKIYQGDMLIPWRVYKSGHSQKIDSKRWRNSHVESEIPTRNSYRWRSRPLSGDLPPTTGAGGGDPHIHTLDGQHYTMLNQGNLNLTKRLFSTKKCVFFRNSAVWKKRLLKVVWHGNLVATSLWHLFFGSHQVGVSKDRKPPTMKCPFGGPIFKKSLSFCPLHIVAAAASVVGVNVN